jgi:predicted RNA-binding Zn ribbon-like protein
MLTGHVSMTGESRAGWRISESVQPGGRPPAPGSLALVQAFVNSYYDLEISHGADLFATPAALRSWLAAHGLITPTARVTDVDRERAIAVREGLRSLAASTGGDDRPALRKLNAAATGAAVELRFGGRGPEFLPSSAGGVPGALGLVLALSACAMIDGSWARLKVCPGVECGWMFFDHSRNQTSRWCSMSVCGARAKARSHYRRHKEASP